MYIDPVLSIAKFQQGKQLAGEEHPLAVFHVVVLAHLLKQFQVFLLQDAPVLVPDLGGCPFHILEIHFGGFSPPGCPMAVRMMRAISRKTPRCSDGCFQRVLINQVQVHPHPHEVLDRVVSFRVVGFQVVHRVQVMLGRKIAWSRIASKFLAVEERAGNGIHDGAIRLHHDLLRSWKMARAYRDPACPGRQSGSGG